MRRLLRRDEGPPVDAEGHIFRYVNPTTGHKSHANDYKSWMAALKEHYRANNIPIPDNIEAVAEDQLCAGLPPQLCLHEGGDPLGVDARIGFNDVVGWMKAVATKVVKGEEYVDQAEAERRAGICVSCYFNTTIVGGCGGGCKKLVEFMTPGMASRQTSQDQRLRSCSVCHCYNRVQIWFPLEILAEDDTAERQEKYPKFCWKRKE